MIRAKSVSDTHSKLIALTVEEHHLVLSSQASLLEARWHGGLQAGQDRGFTSPSKGCMS